MNRSERGGTTHTLRSGQTTLLRTAAVLALAGAAAAVPVRRSTAEGPPAGFSGGFGEQSCVACHIGNEVNAFGGRVGFEGLPEAYEPGAEYTLTVHLLAEETDVAGFQVTARFADGPRRAEDAGRLGSLDTRTVVVDSAGVTYVQQTAAGAVTSDRNGSSWTIAWLAPDGGDVVLNVAANSGNRDNSPLGDLVYTAEATIVVQR